MATMAFNKFFNKEVQEWSEKAFPRDYLGYNTGMISMSDIEFKEAYIKSLNKGAMFDSRCFNIPEEEVTNCLIWRQQDATRNDIQMLGQCNFSHKELQDKSCNDIQDMLMTKRGINFNDMPTEFKRGVCCIKNRMVCEPWGNRMLTNTVEDGKWFIDKNPPIFTQDREYVEINFRGRKE
jgi:tRNA(His) 5'-end guanylyltransferase